MSNKVGQRQLVGHQRQIGLAKRLVQIHRIERLMHGVRQIDRLVLPIKFATVHQTVAKGMLVQIVVFQDASAEAAHRQIDRPHPTCQAIPIASLDRLQPFGLCRQAKSLFHNPA